MTFHALALSFLFTALWSHAERNLLLVAVAHASANAPIIFFESAAGSSIALRAWLLTGLSYALLAGVLVAATWPWWISEQRSARRSAISQSATRADYGRKPIDDR